MFEKSGMIETRYGWGAVRPVHCMKEAAYNQRSSVPRCVIETRCVRSAVRLGMSGVVCV